jgi:hypothetical protein
MAAPGKNDEITWFLKHYSSRECTQIFTVGNAHKYSLTSWHKAPRGETHVPPHYVTSANVLPCYLNTVVPDITPGVALAERTGNSKAPGLRLFFLHTSSSNAPEETENLVIQLMQLHTQLGGARNTATCRHRTIAHRIVASGKKEMQWSC